MSHGNRRLETALAAVQLLLLGAAGTVAIVSEKPPKLIFVLLFAATVLIALTLFLLQRRSTQQLIECAQQLAEETQIIANVNPAHRLQSTAAPFAPLIEALNGLAAQIESLRTASTQALQEARAEVSAERNRLAILLEDLSEGVLVCTLDGRILLYNRSASQLLHSEDAASSSGLIGLGRSIFATLDRNAITHALDQVRHRNASAADANRSEFVTSATNGRLLRVRISPFGKRDDQQEWPLAEGYVLTLQDMTEGIERSSRRDQLLQSLSEQVRASLASMRAASELLEQFPDMSSEQRQRMQQIIHDETQQLSQQLDQILSDYTQVMKAHWRLEEIRADDLLRALRQQLSERLGLTIQERIRIDAGWIKADSFSLLQGVEAIVRWLQTVGEIEQRDIELRLQPLGRFAAFDVAWQTNPAEVERFQHWKEELFASQEKAGSSEDAGSAVTASITLRELAEVHGGEVWFQFEPAERSAYIRILLPLSRRKESRLARSKDPSFHTPSIIPHPFERPEFYDFDLFGPIHQQPSLLRRRLSDLIYTVFDTETTGLDPFQDEILSIGAVRIVNRRQLRREVFEELVNPQIPIPERSQQIHGISNEMVQNQPPLKTVLPRFRGFVEDTVLVGHNVAFDLRMLQMKERATGVVFDMPVLDTLLLSAVLRPGREEHSLEALSARLGVDVVGRHTALGDAIITAEVFLRLIPLLEERGIVTLAQAQEASQKTYYARLEY